MALTITPAGIEVTGNSVRVVCVFDDGAGNAFKEWVPFTGLEDFKNLLRSRSLTIAGTDPLVAQAKAVIGTPIDISAAAAPTPTPLEVFAGKVRTLKNQVSAVGLGVLGSTDSKLIAAISADLAANPAWVSVF